MISEDDLNKLSGVMLYLAILEVFTKTELFENPKELLGVLFGTLEYFFDSFLSRMSEERREKYKKMISLALEKLRAKYSDE